MTIYDAITSMTVEELATTLTELTQNSIQAILDRKMCIKIPEEVRQEAYKNMLEILQSEVEEES